MRRLHLSRAQQLSLALSAGALALPAVAAGPAGAATYPIAPAPTIAAAFSPQTTIYSGGTTALSVTITNPSTQTAPGLAFTDTLPSGVVVDDPNGASGTCGSAGVLTAVPGSGVISLTGGSLAAGASCTVSAAVTATTPGTYTDSTGGLTYTGGSNATAGTAILTVVGVPTIAVTTPAANATYTVGQSVKASYTCTDATGAPGISSCTDDASKPGYLDTAKAGPGEFTVTAISNDGAVVSQTVNYKVLPSNTVSAGTASANQKGAVSFTLKVPGKGKLSVTEQVGSTTITVSKSTAGKSTVPITVAPTRALTKALKAARKAGTSLTAKVSVTFTPKGGKAGHLKLPAVTLS